MSTQPSYALSAGKKDEERLQILNEVYNPSSLAFFKSSGLKPGMSVLDVGCGTGIISCELAKIVGPEGKVTCADISPDQLKLAQSRAETMGLSNLEFVCLSADELGQLKQKFDVIDCRFLLMHLKDPSYVLEQFISLLSPEGLLILEESMGVNTVQCLPEKIPSFEMFYKIARAQYDIQQSNSSIGRILPQMLLDRGLSLIHTELFHPILRTPREKSLVRLGLASVSSRLKEHGVIEEQNLLRDVAEEIELNDKVFILYHQLHRIAAQLKALL